MAPTPENFFFATEQRAYGLVYMPKGVFLDADKALNDEEAKDGEEEEEEEEFKP